MRILFLSQIYKSTHEVLILGICNVLEKNGHLVEKNMHPSNSYDCILVFNRKKLEQYESILKNLKAPIIYLFCFSDIEREYIVSTTITQTIVVKDKIPDLRHFSLASCIYSGMLLPEITLMQNKEIKKEKPIIYVNIDTGYLGELTFLKILPLLNQLHNYQIYYQSKRSIGRQWLNKHIQIIPDKQNMQELISQSDIVIGSGFVAYSAICQCKKTIVVGERGYGGIVTEENIAYHLSVFFQGRSGGKLDEYIPFPLLAKAIGDETLSLRKANEQLTLLQNANEVKFIQFLEKIITNIKQIDFNDASLTYIINPIYNIIKKKNKRWIGNRSFLKLYKAINQSESAVISAFQQPHSIQEVLNIFPVEYANEIKAYIQELIEKKILKKQQDSEENK
ncbi:hypothetical protein FACS189451_10490 [Bacteroidia bacterium]|nr:hypothetical protein FACS189451_10490 [Bacteroidia bacterium]